MNTDGDGVRVWRVVSEKRSDFVRISVSVYMEREREICILATILIYVHFQYNMTY